MSSTIITTKITSADHIGEQEAEVKRPATVQVIIVTDGHPTLVEIDVDKKGNVTVRQDDTRS